MKGERNEDGRMDGGGTKEGRTDGKYGRKDGRYGRNEGYWRTNNK